MATWTIISGTGSGTQLVGCKIVETHTGGTITYEFKAAGTGAPPTLNTTPPNLNNVPYNNSTWNIASSTAPPTWSGTCINTTSPEQDPGTWTAESGGGGGIDDEKPKKHKKSTK